jgi:hypothetical protein
MTTPSYPVAATHGTLRLPCELNPNIAFDGGFILDESKIMKSLSLLLEPYGIPKQDMANFLNVRGVIAGSTAISALNPSFEPGDLDIVMNIPFWLSYQSTKSAAAIRYFEEATAWFAKYGYQEMGHSYGDGSGNMYDFNRWIYKVQTFQHCESKKKVDLVHINGPLMIFLQSTDFTINYTYIAFENKNMDFPVYTEFYVSRFYGDVMGKLPLFLMNADNIFRRDNAFCPLHAKNAQARLNRLEKYLARGYTMEPQLEESYRARLAMFLTTPH